MSEALPFWRTKTLAEMSPEEWESLCDGCAKCCLLKLEDEDTGEIVHTDVACRLLDLATCRCRHYARRQRYVPDCRILEPNRIGRIAWLPSTCAYRLLHEGKDLPAWHPLITGDPESVHRAGVSVRDRVLSEGEVDEDELEDRVVEWPR